jgi:hypothetical protein
MEAAQRTMLLPALRELVTADRSERARLPLESLERQFYLGVEAAAEGLLHPETMVGRAEDWLTRQTAAFREGFLAVQAEIDVVAASGQVPVRIALPKPPARLSSPNTGVGVRPE